MNKKLLNGHAPCGVCCKLCRAREEELLDSGKCLGCRKIHRLGRRAKVDVKDFCSTNICITNKGHTFCYECEEYPCERIQPIVNFENPSIKGSNLPHNLKMYNLAMIKKLGLEEWDKICEEKHDLYYFGRKIDYLGGNGLILEKKGKSHGEKKK